MASFKTIYENIFEIVSLICVVFRQYELFFLKITKHNIYIIVSYITVLIGEVN